MSPSPRTQRRYDHRLRELVQTTGDAQVATQQGVPRSTAQGWLTKTSTEVISLDVLELDAAQLQHEVILLQHRIAKLVCLLRLVVVALKVSGVSFAKIRCLRDRAGQLSQLLRALV